MKNAKLKKGGGAVRMVRFRPKVDEPAEDYCALPHHRQAGTGWHRCGLTWPPIKSSYSDSILVWLRNNLFALFNSIFSRSGGSAVNRDLAWEVAFPLTIPAFGWVPAWDGRSQSGEVPTHHRLRMRRRSTRTADLSINTHYKRAPFYNACLVIGTGTTTPGTLRAYS
jgi:hypothetical protein